MEAKNWKTTVSGVMAIIFGAWGVAGPLIQGQPMAADTITAAISAILAGVGLILAKDAKPIVK